MWTLRRMKVLDLEPLVILDVYMKEFRSVLELVVPAWHSELSKKNAADIERVQRVAVSIISSNCMTGKSECTFAMALVTLNPLRSGGKNCAKHVPRKHLKQSIVTCSWRTTILTILETNRNILCLNAIPRDFSTPLRITSPGCSTVNSSQNLPFRFVHSK